MVSSVYHYGREWIRSQIKGVQSDSNINISRIELDLVAVLDGIYYQNWIGINHKKVIGQGNNVSRLSNNSATFSGIKNGITWKKLSIDFKKNFDYSSLIVFVRENVDMFISVSNNLTIECFDSISLYLKFTLILVQLD